MRRRRRDKSLRQWLAEVRPLMNAPDTPPSTVEAMQWLATMPRSRRRLVHEYAVVHVVRALNATSSEDPAVLEAWLKQDRQATLEWRMKQRPMR